MRDNPNAWAFNLENLVFSKLKAKLTANLKEKYPQINVTMDTKLREDTKFPTVLVQILSMHEKGNTLEGDLICGVDMQTQINVYVTKKQGFSVAREVESEVVDAMKSMLFNSTMQQVEFDNDEILTSVLRFDRIFGQGDKI